jgi:hypothetical protein
VALDHVGFRGSGRYGISDSLNNRFRDCLSQLQGQTGQGISFLANARREFYAIESRVSILPDSGLRERRYGVPLVALALVLRQIP